MYRAAGSSLNHCSQDSCSHRAAPFACYAVHDGARCREVKLPPWLQLPPCSYASFRDTRDGSLACLGSKPQVSNHLASWPYPVRV